MRFFPLFAIALAFILFLSFSGCAKQGADSAQPEPAKPVQTIKTGDNVSTNKTSDAKMAAKGDSVSVHYIGKLTNGTLFDTSVKEEAVKAGLPLRPSYDTLTFTVGAGQMIAGFDATVVGMKEGEEKTVTLAPEQAYGMPNPDAIISIPVANIGNADSIEVGSMLYAQNGASGKVIEVKNGTAKVDFNHELAGKPLVFTIRMVKIQKK
jgi:FKBP-type peptidyl-prolyl cis-trans isomerase 2